MNWTDSDKAEMVDSLAKDQVIHCPTCGSDVLTASVSASKSLGVKYIFNCSNGDCKREEVIDVTDDPRFSHLK